MKKAVRILIVTAGVFALFLITICAVLVIKMNSQVKSFDKSAVDVSQVKDGVY